MEENRLPEGALEPANSHYYEPYNEGGMYYPGITILDYFAAAAMKETLVSYGGGGFLVNGDDEKLEIFFGRLAEMSYDAAAAMCRERERRMNE